MAQPGVIELQVDKIGQLFNTLDPMPFREKDLAKEAEDYIVGWARELPRAAPLRILIHMPSQEAAGEQAAMLGPAIASYFRYRAEALTQELKELFRIGRYSLLVGLLVLTVCITGGGLILASRQSGHLGMLLNEGLIILGWVANWRPIEIFLYDWWPIVRHRNVLKRLAEAQVVITQDKAAES